MLPDLFFGISVMDSSHLISDQFLEKKDPILFLSPIAVFDFITVFLCEIYTMRIMFINVHARTEKLRMGSLKCVSSRTCLEKNNNENPKQSFSECSSLFCDRSQKSPVSTKINWQWKLMGIKGGKVDGARKRVTHFSLKSSTVILVLSMSRSILLRSTFAPTI